jgi:hypothetical protein
MSLQLDQVVPWGRSLDEYTRMFDLTEAELEQRIIGVGDGPASFNTQMRARGRHVVSIDPIYAFTAEQIRARVHETHERLVAAADENRELFNWDHIKSPQEMGRVRMAAMEGFLADFDAGKGEGRYLTASLPKLPFADSSFDLALCSHLLFLYTQQISFEDHIAGIIEMARVAREVRIFPLLMLGNTPSPHVSPAVEVLASRGYACEIRRVPYEFQKGGNEMLVVRGISAGST